MDRPPAPVGDESPAEPASRRPAPAPAGTVVEPAPAAPAGPPVAPAGAALARAGGTAAAVEDSTAAEAVREVPWWRRRWDPAAVTLGELLVLGATVVVAVVALVSLATAHLRVHSLGTVGAGSAVLLAVLAVLAQVRSRPPRLVLDLAGLLPAAVSAVVAAVMFLPGFHYVAGDRDPGGYVMEAFSIARRGSYDLVDAALAARLPVQMTSPAARFPGIWVHDAATGQIVPQFYHLWPALMGTSYDLRGYGGLANTGPLVGVLAVLLAVLLARRIAGPVAGWAAGLVLATNMMEVWQAKYPTAEIFAQLLYLGALLGVGLAVQTRWRWPALVAGMLVSVGYLNRPDGVLILFFAVAVLATLWVLGRFDARAGWFAGGLLALLPYGLWQAYGPAGFYTKVNTKLGLATVLLLLGGCVVGALLLRPLLGGLARWVDRRVADARTQRWVGAAVVLGALGLFGLGVVRPAFGADYTYYGTRLIRSYDEHGLWRLAWFFTWPGLLVMLVGIGYVALRRWSAPGWLVLALTVGLLTLYCWHARNSTYLMWWGRRFVSTVVPGMVLLIAVGLAWMWALRWRGRLRVGVPVAAGLAAFLCVVQLQQSAPLRSHDEWGGSYGVSRSVADLSGGQQGVFLWARAKYCCAAPQTLFASPLWLVDDQVSVLLPDNPAATAGYLRKYLDHFRGQPVFLVYEGAARPPAMPGLRVAGGQRFTGALPHWQESDIVRPDHALRIRYDFTVYRVTAG